MAFAERLKLLRNKKELTQREFAKIISVSPSAVAMWETGEREPNHEMLKSLAEYFDCTIDYILGRPDRKNILDSEGKTSNALDDLSEEDKREAIRYITYLRYTSKGDEETSATLEKGSK